MKIAILADNNKKELMVEFCLAYSGILSRHTLCATAKTARLVAEATGLPIEELLSGDIGGVEQITSMVTYNDIDIVLFLRCTDYEAYGKAEHTELLRMCDLYNVPAATNLAVAEVLVRALDDGDLDWRPIVSENAKKNNNNDK